MRRFRTLPPKWRLALAAVALALAFPFLCDLTISLLAIGRTHQKARAVPETPVALLLGTAKTYRGRPNQFYRTRIAAAAELYAAGRVRGILASGDNSRSSYNEPEQMRRDLIARGVPESAITLDYAGFRTLDSIIRAKEVFGQRRLVVVSQKFHAERALFLAALHGVEASAFTAADPGWRLYLKIRAREVLARTAAVLDVVVGRDPKFLGEPEEVHLGGA